MIFRAPPPGRRCPAPSGDQAQSLAQLVGVQAHRPAPPEGAPGPDWPGAAELKLDTSKPHPTPCQSQGCLTEQGRINPGVGPYLGHPDIAKWQERARGGRGAEAGDRMGRSVSSTKARPVSAEGSNCNWQSRANSLMLIAQRFLAFPRGGDPAASWTPTLADKKFNSTWGVWGY